MVEQLLDRFVTVALLGPRLPTKRRNASLYCELECHGPNRTVEKTKLNIV